MKKFNNFKPLNEITLPTLKIDEILDDVPTSTSLMKNVLATYYKTYEEYIDIVDKNKHIYKIYDLSGEIMNNNRSYFNSCIFEKQDIHKIKQNIIDYSIGEFHYNLPNNLNIFGIDLKPSSFINKEDLKMSFDNTITIQDTLNIIGNILGYERMEQFNDFYIWTSKKI
jgi:hypothetical protein